MTPIPLEPAERYNPRINYRFLQWSPKVELPGEAKRLVEVFVNEAKAELIAIELFDFQCVDDKYVQSAEIEDSAAMWVIATISSAALDRLLLNFDMELAGHLRNTGPNAVFDHEVYWPIGLAPGPSDLLLVVQTSSPNISVLIQRRLLTNQRLDEIRNGV